MDKKIAIILVNYKDYAKKFLAECRDGLRKQNYPKELFMVYIVDNDSSEESKNFLNENYPEAKIIPRVDGNYAAANNAGIKKGIEDGCEFFVIANMDTKFEENWLLELMNAVESEKEIGIAQSKILLYSKSGEKKINTLGNLIDFLGFGFTSAYNENDREINGLPEITYASGCSFIVKKEVLEKIGLYNEEYYMYHDDMEIGWRAKLAGYKIVLAPKSVVYHKYEFSRSVKMIYFMERNRYMAIFSFYRIPTLILIFPALLFMDLGILFYSFLNGWYREKIKVYLYFLNLESWKKIIETRKNVHRYRKINDKSIVKNFLGKIGFQEISNPVLDYFANPIFNLYWKIAKRIISW